MRRTISILMAVTLIVVLMATTVTPAFANHKSYHVKHVGGEGNPPCWSGHWGWGVQDVGDYCY